MTTKPFDWDSPDPKCAAGLLARFAPERFNAARRLGKAGDCPFKALSQGAGGEAVAWERLAATPLRGIRSAAELDEVLALAAGIPFGVSSRGWSILRSLSMTVLADLPESVRTHLCADLARINAVSAQRQLSAKGLRDRAEDVADALTILRLTITTYALAADRAVDEQQALRQRAEVFANEIAGAMSLPRAMKLARHMRSAAFLVQAYGEDFSWATASPTALDCPAGRIVAVSRLGDLCGARSPLADADGAALARGALWGDAAALVVRITATDGGRADALLRHSTDPDRMFDPVLFWRDVTVHPHRDAEATPGVTESIDYAKGVLCSDGESVLVAWKTKRNTFVADSREHATDALKSILATCGPLASSLAERLRALKQAGETNDFADYDVRYGEPESPLLKSVSDPVTAHLMRIARFEMC